MLEAALRFVDIAGATPSELVAWHPKRRRARRPGKVEVRDRDPANPTLELVGRAAGGVDAEKKVEVYRAPGRFRVEGDGAREARLSLEAIRATADVLSFETTAYALRPGVAFETDDTPGGGPDIAGWFLVIETELEWIAGGDRGALRVRSIPLATPFRLARVAPHPRIAGMLPARTTGAVGGRPDPRRIGEVRVGVIDAVHRSPSQSWAMRVATG